MMAKENLRIETNKISKIKKMLDDGHSTRDIADALSCSLTTINNVRKDVYNIDGTEQKDIKKEQKEAKQQVVLSTKGRLEAELRQDSYLYDIDKKNAKIELNILKKKYDTILTEIESKDNMHKLWDSLQKQSKNIKIEKSLDDEHTESTAVLVASDWHIEEIVDPETVNYLNEYNPEIAKQRAIKFWQNGLKMVDMMAKDEKINNVVVALLGDFISGYIHPELVENNPMSPTEAILYVKSLITAGIDMFLKNSNYNITIVTAFGNHGRIGDKKKISTGWKNSYEWMMYNLIAQQYENEDRVKFKIEKGYHNYINIYDKILRVHHGDAIKYQGGVGGITIPINKAIAQRNKAKRADIDVLGHRHQMRDMGNAITNGSLIGYGPYAENIKADYEEPKQIMFLINSKYGKTITAPIIVN